jgi:hypothetical protein
MLVFTERRLWVKNLIEFFAPLHSAIAPLSASSPDHRCGQGAALREHFSAPFSERAF